MILLAEAELKDRALKVTQAVLKLRERALGERALGERALGERERPLYCCFTAALLLL